MIKNPFDINKAVDYTDEDIFKYWVDINDQAGFNEMLKPDSLMPMIMEGSKGSGKTHIMKYYSYELQKIRITSEKGSSIKEGFEKESFIGLYIRCSGLNANVFSGKGVDDNTWESLFAFYWELWIGERLIYILSDMQSKGIIDAEEDADLVKGIIGLFMSCNASCSNLNELREYFMQLQKKLLYEIHNFLLLGKSGPQVDITLNIGALTYGIPNLLKAKVGYFKRKHILYLIDEYENFSEQQQQVMMTLLREKPTSCSIRIGTRPYGIRTYFTMGKIEENREGSEYERVKLDEKIREAENYKDYLKNICIKRLQGIGVTLSNDYDLNAYIENISSDELLEKARHAKLTSKVKEKLGKNLEKYRAQSLSETEIKQILECLSFEQDLVAERTCMVFIYKKIKAKSTDLVGDAKAIREMVLQYQKKNNLSENEMAKYLNYYRTDIRDAIARSANIPIPYYGLDTLIKLSCGTPRTLLRLLKYAFSKQYFNTSKEPFVKGRTLKVESQQAGIEDTYNWFFEENRIPNDVNGVMEAVKRLGSYLQNVRFSDLPPQCSIDIFSVQEENLSSEALRTLKMLEMYSYIVPHKDRRKKNADSKSSTYKLNTILIPKFELSLETRGNVELSKTDAEIILNPNRADEYEDFVKSKLKAYNFPFIMQKGVKKPVTPTPAQPTLFDDYGL
jgi:hypothetical protein